MVEGLEERIVEVVEGFATTIHEMKLGHEEEGYNTLFEHILHPEANTKACGDNDDEEGVPGSMGVDVKAEAKAIRVKRPRVNEDA